jgi:phytoene synthase
MRFEADRARGFYREAQPLVGLVHKRSRPALRALIGIYSRLLERIEESGFDVTRRMKLSAVEKGWIVVRAWMGW